jgi:formylglycine-generating enzyme required for sulfatase activity
MKNLFLKPFLGLLFTILLVLQISGCSTDSKPPENELTNQPAPMVLVPAGYFTMGVRSPAWAENSETYTVWLDDYYIDQYEVTNASYRQCVDEGGCTPPPEKKELEDYSREKYYDNSAYKYYPVINLNWSEANTYCEWRGARLPTEAEWQKAARGTDSRAYPWGDTEPTCNLANYGFADRTCSLPLGVAQVGSRPDGASPYNVYDLAGNVEEWVADCYVRDPSSYLEDKARNPIAPETLDCHRVLHGGSFFLDGFNFLEIDKRNGAKPEYGTFTLGFRCVVSP